MIRAIDIAGELEGRPALDGRGAHTTEEEATKAFARLSDFRDGAIFAGRFSGDSGWERHLKGDELVQILSGATRFQIITEEGTQTLELSAGELVVVPRGCWHRFQSRDGVTLLTATPQPTQHTYAADPRQPPTDAQ